MRFVPGGSAGTVFHKVAVIVDRGVLRDDGLRLEGGLGIVESTVGVTEGLLEMDDSLLLNVLTCSEVECKDSPLLIESGGLSQHITKCESRFFMHERSSTILFTM